MSDFKQVCEYLKKASLRGSKLGLERVSLLMNLLNNPQNKLKVIHVSGTNGKGSFCAMLNSVLKESGYKTGAFNSPALTGITDYFRINGKEISENKFAEIMTELIPVCESMDEKPTEFEVISAAAYLLFYRENCDIAIVECCMGGDTDATNTVESPILSVITNVRKDHTAFLGDTLPEIAQHKAGIIKNSRPVFYGGKTDSEVYKVIKNKAESLNSELYTNNSKISDIDYSLDGISFTYGDKKLYSPLIGTYQINNISNVLNCVEILNKNGLEISDKALENGLKNTKWHGRFEIISRNPLVIFDGAHNPDGISQAVNTIEKYFDKIVLLIGVMADKEYNLYNSMLGRFIDRAFTVKPDNPRALDSETLAETFENAESCPIFSEGVRKAYSYAKEKNLPLIALGSLYMYREFTDTMKNIDTTEE